MLLATLVGIVKDGIVINTAGEDLADKLSQALKRYKIPQNQFDEVDSEM